MDGLIYWMGILLKVILVIALLRYVMFSGVEVREPDVSCFFTDCSYGVYSGSSKNSTVLQ